MRRACPGEANVDINEILFRPTSQGTVSLVPRRRGLVCYARRMITSYCLATEIAEGYGRSQRFLARALDWEK